MQSINTKKLLSCLSFIFLFSIPSFSQQSPVDALKKYYEEYPEEKLYLWYNKTAYVAGETIWFKAYVFSGYTLSVISSSLFVELYDGDRRLISTRLLPVIAGVSEGSIDLNKELDEGVYYIRAYTKWMLNFNEKYQHIQPLLIYNHASAKKLIPDKSAWDAVAFPEGGSLIAGVDTKVAIRRNAVAPESKWSGYVYEETNPQVHISGFQSIDENVGLLTFTPEARKRYYLYVTDESGNYKICPLPLVKSNGVGLSVENTGDSILYRLRFENIPGNGNGYQVIGEIQHQLIHHALLKKTGAELVMKIPAHELGNGILRLTVFDPAYEVAAERLVFLNQTKPGFDSSVISQQTVSFQPRDQNKLMLEVDSINWISYAISVEDASSSLPPRQDNIFSALWLSSDLTGPVQNASSYFEGPDKIKILALDALMISEQWSRFKWADIIHNKYPQIRYLPDKFLSYTGKVTRGKKLKPDEEVNLVLFYPDSSKQFLHAVSDSAGDVRIENVLFMNEARIFYQLNSKKYAAKLIDIDFERNNEFVSYSLPFPNTAYKLQYIIATESNHEFIRRADNAISMERDIEKKYKTLQEVVVNAKIRNATEKLNEELSTGLFRSSGEIIFDFVNEQQNALGYTNILQWLQGRVAGLTMNIADGGIVPYIRGSQATIYVDEMRADPGLIAMLSVNDIAMIKVIKGPFALMTGSGGGTIAIYTLRGNLQPAQKQPSMPHSSLKGYDVAKKFFSPYYDIKSIPQPDTDTRDQLLWQTIISPTIGIDKARVVFFNNDNAKRYKVIIQGITEKGVPVYVERLIEEEKKAF